MIRKICTATALVTALFSARAFTQKVTVDVFTEHYKNNAGSDTVYYETDRPLQWSDFQGKVPPDVPWGAMTASGFSFNSSMDQDGSAIHISVGVYTFFIRHESWKKRQAHTAYQLEHEQHHFDLTRLGAAKLEHEIRNARFTPNNYRRLLNSIFEKVYSEESQWQKRYDLDTRNSLDTTKQLQWNSKISEDILKLKKGTREMVTP